MLGDKPDVSQVEIPIRADYMYINKPIHKKAAFGEEYAYRTEFAWLLAGRKPKPAAKNVRDSFVGVYRV